MIAQSTPSGSSDSLFQLVQYGALGLVVVALLFGWLWAKPAVQQLIARAEKAEAQRDALISLYEQKVLPVLSEVVPATQKMVEVADEMMRRLDRDRP